jgi:hypothetical protein
LDRFISLDAYQVEGIEITEPIKIPDKTALKNKAYLTFASSDTQVANCFPHHSRPHEGLQLIPIADSAPVSIVKPVPPVAAGQGSESQAYYPRPGPDALEARREIWDHLAKVPDHPGHFCIIVASGHVRRQNGSHGLKATSMATQADVRGIALALPQTEETVEHFAFSVRNKAKLKGFVWAWMERIEPKKPRVPHPDVIAVRVANLAEKDRLLALGPTKFFTEPHYNGFPAILVHLPTITVRELEPLIKEAWRCQAPKALKG